MSSRSTRSGGGGGAGAGARGTKRPRTDGDQPDQFKRGKFGDDEAGRFNEVDRMGCLLNLDDGSLRFFKNGVEHGPGYPAGSVTGPVARAVQVWWNDKKGQDAVRLLPNAEWPAGHAP